MPEKKQVLKEVYVTKWVFTQGILRYTNVEQCSDTMIHAQSRNLYLHKPHWHPTIEEARARTELMRMRAVEATKKKLRKLQTLQIEQIEVHDA